MSNIMAENVTPYLSCHDRSAMEANEAFETASVTFESK